MGCSGSDMMMSSSRFAKLEGSSSALSSFGASMGAARSIIVTSSLEFSKKERSFLSVSLDAIDIRFCFWNQTIRVLVFFFFFLKKKKRERDFTFSSSPEPAIGGLIKEELAGEEKRDRGGLRVEIGRRGGGREDSQAWLL
jgi:hypothetical protein